MRVHKMTSDRLLEVSLSNFNAPATKRIAKNTLVIVARVKRRSFARASRAQCTCSKKFA